jgi:hypothetical protein
MTFNAIFNGFKAIVRDVSDAEQSALFMTRRGARIASTRFDRSSLTSAGALSFAGGTLCKRTRLASANVLRKGL